MTYRTLMMTASVSATLTLGAAIPAQAVVFHSTDGTIDGSLCIGLDCPTTPSFGFTTLLLRENNLRMKFDDSSSTASFPNNDWSLEANESSNGGRNAFFLRDCGVSNQGNCSGNAVFTVEAGARNNALYVEDDGDIGIGTSTPAVDVHIQTGNTPTLRLAQDGSAGFTPQTFDVAGNETNFFIRDATNGSTLPLRIRPGAPTSAIDIAADGDVGIGTSSPDAFLDVENNGAFVFMRLTAATASPNIAGDITFTDAGDQGELRFNIENAVGNEAGGFEMSLDHDGNLTIDGDLVTGGSGTCAPPNPPCDAVFDPAVYTVPSIEEHAALMWENMYLPAVGPTGPGQQVNVSDKLLRMLNELEHAHIYIEELNERIKVLEAALADKG